MIRLKTRNNYCLQSLSNSACFSDLRLFSDSSRKHIRTHRVVFAGLSRFLRSCFNDIPEDDTTSLLLPDFSFKTLNMFIEFAYNGEISCKESEHTQILELMDLLCIDKLNNVTKCEFESSVIKLEQTDSDCGEGTRSYESHEGALLDWDHDTQLDDAGFADPLENTTCLDIYVCNDLSDVADDELRSVSFGAFVTCADSEKLMVKPPTSAKGSSVAVWKSKVSKPSNETSPDNIPAEKVPRFSCKLCDKSYANYKHFQGHYRKVHPDHPVEENPETPAFYTCNSCNKYYRNSWALKKHMKVCGKELSSFSAASIVDCTVAGDEPDENTDATSNSAPMVALQKSMIDEEPSNEMNLNANHQQQMPQFKCKLCDKSYANYQHYQKHYRRFHPDFRIDENPETPAYYTCRLCSKSYRNSWSLKRHIKDCGNALRTIDHSSTNVVDQKHKDDKPDVEQKRNKPDDEMECVVLNNGDGITPNFKCKLCYKSYANYSHFRRHYRDYHPDSPMDENPETPALYNCSSCDKSYRNFKHLKLHMKVTHSLHLVRQLPPTDPGRYFCNICCKSFSRQFHLNRHNRNFHPENSAEQAASENTDCYTCDVCDESYDELDQLEEHLLVHSAVEPSDSQNEQNPSHHDQLRLESGQTTSIPPLRKPCLRFKCDVCFHVYTSDFDLQAHIQTHPESFSCNECSELFRSGRHLEAHRKKNHAEKNFMCAQCGKSFVKAIQLKSHAKTHDENRQPQFKCDQCPKAFLVFESLKYHALVHTGERPHMCDMCPKTFTTYANLKVHLQFHRNERKYGCEICKKRFNAGTNLRRHLRAVHGQTDDRRDCDVCYKSFKNRDSLRAHKFKAHFIERPYTCDYCLKAFFTSDILRRHAVKYHSGGRRTRRRLKALLKARSISVASFSGL